MRKFSIYFACFFTLILMGCGDTSGDPTAQITLAADTAASAGIAPGGSAVITATVKKVIGKTTDPAEAAPALVAAWGENVTFRLLTANGGQLSALTRKTDSNGVAMTVYTAGNNYNNDTIQATLDNGMSASIVITKTGGLVGARISTLAALPTTVAPYQTSVLTATVTDGNSPPNPIMGEAVTFTIPTNWSDACFIDASFACVASVTVNTDAGGHAVALYRGGGYDPYSDVSDTVRAALANGSSNALVITRSAGTLTVYSITVEAVPTTVAVVGGSSVITANVKATTGSTVSGVSGVTVTFTTTGGSVSPASATTDGSGNAVTTFTASGGVTLTTAGVVTASITVDGNTYTDVVVVTYQ